jgi:hypothetical protein
LDGYSCSEESFHNANRNVGIIRWCSSGTSADAVQRRRERREEATPDESFNTLMNGCQQDGSKDYNSKKEQETVSRGKKGKTNKENNYFGCRTHLRLPSWGLERHNDSEKE